MLSIERKGNNICEFKQENMFRSSEATHGCGLDDEVRKEMNRIQRSAERPDDEYTNYMTM